MPASALEFILPFPLAAAAQRGAASGVKPDSTAANRDCHLREPSDGGAKRFGAGRSHDGISGSVQAALAAVEPFRRPVERRREARHPYPYPIHLTPFDSDGDPDIDRTLVVIGKHLAPHGLDFYSPQPLAERRMIASLDRGREGWIGLVVELEWCRFSRHGWYDNGGRFVEVVASPLLDLDDRPRAA